MPKKPSKDQLRVTSLAEWSSWLSRNFDKSEVIWLVFKKKSRGPVPFDYAMALDEALCWGWVDSLLKRIDENEYMRKFTPRKATSTWSDHNKKRVERLIREGRMQEPGKRAIEAGKKSGMWDKGIEPTQLDDSLPGALLQAFQHHPDARDRYFRMKESARKQYNIWINHAKRAETIRKRVDETIQLLKKGEELGLR